MARAAGRIALILKPSYVERKIRPIQVLARVFDDIGHLKDMSVTTSHLAVGSSYQTVDIEVDNVRARPPVLNDDVERCFELVYAVYSGNVFLRRNIISTLH